MKDSSEMLLDSCLIYSKAYNKKAREEMAPEKVRAFKTINESLTDSLKKGFVSVGEFMKTIPIEYARIYWKGESNA